MRYTSYLNTHKESSMPLQELLNSLNEYRDLDISRAKTLPPELYTSPDLYQHEVKMIWEKKWICVAHVLELQDPGDYVGVEILGEPIIVVRGDDMKIRAMSSVCRHRFMPIVNHGERGTARSITCPYHRWMYELDGKVKNALHMESNECFQEENVSLPQFGAEVWNGFVYVNLDPSAEPFAPGVEGLDQHFKRNGIENLDDWVLYETYDKVWDCNWKASNENSLESYHHMGVHLGSIEHYVPTQNVNNEMEFGENYSIYKVPFAMDRALSQQLAAGWQSGDLGMQEPTLEISFTGPSTAYTVQPGSFGYFTMWPEGPDKTRVWCATFVPRWIAEARNEESLTRKIASDANESANFTERVMDEDGFAMPGIQRALTSSFAERGNLSWLEEPILRWYQWLTRSLVAEGDQK